MRNSTRLLASIALSCAAALAAADDYQVFGSTANQYLWNSQLDELHALADQREADVAASLESVEALEARKAEMRQHYDEMLGWMPERTPLNAQVTGTITVPGENYTIEKIVYESRPGHHVTANLYLPTGITEPVPGVLIACGHSGDGKAYDAYQRASILMAKNGMATLIFDPICQGERQQGSGFPGTTTGHTLCGTGARALGMSSATYEVWDAVRSLDYLAGRPEVDASRLGMTGNSGGGTQTAWVMAHDERIVAAAPSCFITTSERVITQFGPQDDEQHFTNQGLYGLEHSDFITMRSPKPTRILAAERDYFPIAGTREAYAEAQAAYDLQGASDAVDLFTYDDPHGFSQPRREAAVQWMKQWLLDDAGPVTEPTLTVQTVETLRATPTGQVWSSYANEQTAPDLNLDRAEQLAGARETFWATHDDDACRAEIRALLNVPEELATPTVNSEGTIQRDGYQIEKLAINRPGETPIAALLFSPEGQTEPAPAAVFVDGVGKANGAGVGGPVESLVAQGKVVLSIDARGYGETKDSQGSVYRNDEYRTSIVAMYNGQPLLGGRVEDILVSLDVLLDRSNINAESVELIGVGRAAPVALHAAALDERFTHIEVRDPAVTSWIDDVVARPLNYNLLGHVVPGALEKYDLPDLDRLLPNDPIPDPVPDEPTVLRWRFDGNLYEEGAVYNGTAVGNAMAGADNGAYAGSGAVYFDGDNDGVSISRNVLGDGAFSIVFWSKTHADGSDGYFLCDSGAVENLLLRRYDTDGPSLFNAWIDGQHLGRFGPDGTEATSWPVDTWRHHVITVDKYGRQKWYVDGQALESFLGISFEGLEGELYLGNRAAMDRDFHGWLDDLQIYNWALESDDVAFLLSHPGEIVDWEELAGDLNGDGFVGGDDLDVIRGHWGQTVTPGDLGSGDPSGDGFVGGDDLDVVRSNWGAGTPPAATAVPEPSPLACLGGLWLSWTVCRLLLSCP